MKSKEIQVGQILAREDRHKRLCVSMCLNKNKTNMKFMIILEYFDNNPTTLFSNVFISYKNWDDKSKDFLDFKSINNKQLKEIFNDLFSRNTKINKEKMLL